MSSRVAIVNTDKGMDEAFKQALDLIGGLEDLEIESQEVSIKVGIYDARNLNYPSVPVVQATVDSFSRAKKVYLAESANHNGEALDRLQVWKELFSDRVVPFDLSHDCHVREGFVCGERILFSHILFKPKLFVSLHVLREGTAGSVFKNLLGLIPDTRKERFHDKLGTCLIDIAETIGWIDLAVIDATYAYEKEWQKAVPMERKRRDLLILGRDPVAVETVGSILVREDPLSIPAISVARDRKLGETDIKNIDILGESLSQLIS